MVFSWLAAQAPIGQRFLKVGLGRSERRDVAAGPLRFSECGLHDGGDGIDRGQVTLQHREPLLPVLIEGQFARGTRKTTASALADAGVVTTHGNALDGGLRAAEASSFNPHLFFDFPPMGAKIIPALVQCIACGSMPIAADPQLFQLDKGLRDIVDLIGHG